MGSVVFNVASINAKVAAWGKTSAGQAKINAVINNYIQKGTSSVMITGTGNLITKAQMAEAAEKMKSILTQCASGLPASVQAHVANASIGPITQNGPSSYAVELSFDGDMFRPSLQPSRYGGVSNIVALFNNGYFAGNQVVGEWHGQTVGSKTERAGTHFVTQAVSVFNSTCGGQYHATASASGEYA